MYKVAQMADHQLHHHKRTVKYSNIAKVIPGLWARHSVTFACVHGTRAVLSSPAPSDVLPAPAMLLRGGRVGDKEFAQAVTSVQAQGWE